MIFSFLALSALAAVGASPLQKRTLTGPTACQAAGEYTLCQNLWGANSGVGSQNSTLISVNGNTVSWSTTYTWANNQNNVKSYANVESNTAKGVQLSAITSAPTSWSWSYLTQSAGIRADVSYDIWFGKAASGNPATSASSYEIMIWLSGKGGIQPVGSQITTGTQVAGYSWNLWKGPNSNWEVFSFVSANGDINNFNVDLNDFFKYLVSEQGVAETQFVQAIQTGTEPFTGNATLDITSYSVAINSWSLSFFSDETPPLSPSTRSSVASSNSSLSLPKSYSDSRLPLDPTRRDAHGFYQKLSRDSRPVMYSGRGESNIEEEVVQQDEDRGRPCYTETSVRTHDSRPGMPRQGSYSKRHSSFDTHREVPFPSGYLSSSVPPLTTHTSVLHERSSSVPAVSPGSDLHQRSALLAHAAAIANADLDSSALSDSADDSASSTPPPPPPRRPKIERASSSSLPLPTFTDYSTLPAISSPAPPPRSDAPRAPPPVRSPQPNATEFNSETSAVAASPPRTSSLKPPISKFNARFELPSTQLGDGTPSPPLIASEPDGFDDTTPFLTSAPPFRHDPRLHNSLPPPPKLMPTTSFGSTSTARPTSLPHPIDNAPMPSSDKSPVPPPQPPTILTPPPLSESEQNARTPAPYEPFLPREQLPSDHTYIAVETMPSEYRLIVRLPGFQRDSITLSMRRRRILHLVADNWSDGGGHFERRISFGYDAELSSVRAEFDGEYLRIVVPRRELPGWYTIPTN